MAEFFAMLWRQIVSILFPVPSQWTLDQGQRYRLRLIMKTADLDRELARKRIAQVLTEEGFADVKAFVHVKELPLNWEGIGADTARDPNWIAWAEVTWPGLAATHPIDFVLFVVARTDKVSSAQASPGMPSKVEAVAGGDRMLTPTRPEVVFTQDHSWGFYEGLDAIQRRRGWPKGAIGMLAVMMSESTIKANAHNPHGDASGLIQFMPKTLADLGWQGTHEDFRRLTAEQQVPWVERYFTTRPHMPSNPDLTTFYVATFLPAFIPNASDPDFVLARAPTANYEFNKGAFDLEQKGFIRVSDLTRRIQSQMVGPRWKEAVNRLAFVERGGSGGSLVATAAKIVGAGVLLGGLSAAGYYLASAALSRA
jgi:hypothetical protein